MKRLLLLLLITTPALAAQTLPDEHHPMPEWAHAEMTRLIGTWHTDNSAYQSEDEPYEAYGIEWSWGIGETNVVGRLFALYNGEEVGPFWEFRQFWHPGEGAMMVYQFGWGGVVGIGPMEQIDEHSSRLLQTFYNPDGPARLDGHRTTFRDGDKITESFNVDENGTWVPRRTYTWKKVD